LKRALRVLRKTNESEDKMFKNPLAGVIVAGTTRKYKVRVDVMGDRVYTAVVYASCPKEAREATEEVIGFEVTEVRE